MLRNVLQRLRAWRSYARRRERYLRNRKPSAFAPYSISLYADFLRQAKLSPRLEVPPFVSTSGFNGGFTRLFFRHDVDTAGCAAKLHAMLDADLAGRVPAAVYIRADAMEYHPSVLAQTVCAYRKAGVEFGLHTSCYVEDDYLATFRAETDRFAQAFGFAPRSFTVHGLGDYRYEIRLRFGEEIIPRLEEFGYIFTDCNQTLRAYDYVISDCHLEATSGRRYIYNDFFMLPKFFAPGMNYLVLTHPCYWR